MTKLPAAGDIFWLCCLPQANFLTILPAAGEIFWVFCPPQAKFFEYFARHSRIFLSILPTAGNFVWLFCPLQAIFFDYVARRRRNFLSIFHAAGEIFCSYFACRRRIFFARLRRNFVTILARVICRKSSSGGLIRINPDFIGFCLDFLKIFILFSVNFVIDWTFWKF